MGLHRGSGSGVGRGDASGLRKGRCPGTGPGGRARERGYQSIWGHLGRLFGVDGV